MDALGIPGFINVINDTLDIANNALDFIFLWGGLAVILGYPVYYFIQNAAKYNKEKPNNKTKNKGVEILWQTFILFLTMTVAGLFWLLPELMLLAWPKLTLFSSVWGNNWIRWIELAGIFTFFIYIFGHENGGGRWLQSSIGHIALIFLGLFIDRWVGILFISLPILAAYYSILYRLAIILLPTSNPEDRAEKQKRFIIFAAYTWGLQFPMIVADGNGWNKTETRIPGDFTWDYPVPGMIWTKSHQVAAITAGVKFQRVDGPGVIFTGKMERPEQIFDLRLQLRTNEIDVVSKDGVSFKARVFTGFRMDPDTWDKNTYDTLRPMNNILRGADKPTYTKGSFPFSKLRVQAALGITSTKAAAGNPTIYWDEWALSVIEDQARKAVSQKNLDELWRPTDDKKFANALDKIANEIKENAALIFRAKGILLVVSRIVNFRFTGDNNQVDEISKQQLATWGSEWESKRTKILAEAEAESEHAQQEARAYAEALLLNSIADGLQKAKEIDPDLPRYVIAMRFLSSLQDFVHKQPEEKNMQELETSFKEWQEQYFPKQGKEK